MNSTLQLLLLLLFAHTCPAEDALAKAREDAKGKKVLVIGGTQFIGRHTVKWLLDAGASVEILHRGSSPNPFKDKVSETRCDRKKPCLASKLREGPWDMVVDFPVYSKLDAKVIFDNAEHIRHYVFISTDNVYMVADRKKFTRTTSGRLLEDSAVRPADKAKKQKLNAADMYGHQKLQVEEHLSSSSLKFTSLRLPDVWGPFENTGRFEEFVHMLRDGQLIGLKIGRAVGAGEKFKPGFVFAQDVAQIVLLLLSKGPQQQAINVAIAEDPTFKELAEESHAVLKNRSKSTKLPPLQFSKRMQAPLVSTDAGPLDISRAEALGFVATPWQQGWSEAISFATKKKRNEL